MRGRIFEKMAWSRSIICCASDPIREKSEDLLRGPVAEMAPHQLQDIVQPKRGLDMKTVAFA